MKVPVLTKKKFARRLGAWAPLVYASGPTNSVKALKAFRSSLRSSTNCVMHPSAYAANAVSGKRRTTSKRYASISHVLHGSARSGFY